MDICDIIPSKGARALRFTWLTGDMDWKDYWGQWVSKKFNNGDFDYWLVLAFNNTGGDGGEADEKYMCELCCVIPSEASAEDVERFKQTSDFDSWGSLDNPRDVVELFMYNGEYVSFGVMYGNNARKLRRDVAVRAIAATSMFRYFMDTPQNALGATGWDVAKGNRWGNYGTRKE